MLRDQKIFKVFWATVKLLGFQPHLIRRKHKIRAYLIFFILIMLIFTLFIAALVTTSDLEVRISALQSLPLFIGIILEFINFFVNSKKIEKNLKRIDEFFVEVDGEKFREKSFSLFRINYMVNAVNLFLSLIAVSLTFMITGKSTSPTYTPWNDGVGFFAIWFLQTISFVYLALLYFLLDQISISLIIFLSFCMKALKTKMKSLKVADAKQIVELHLNVLR